jgi:TPP-dependent pyruvate/acetoin dehydrogenase alpha subunit
MNDVVEFYRQMLRIRMVEEQLIKLKDLGEIPGSMHLCIGQEAIPVGVSAHLTADDYVVATYRGHGWAISRGTSPAAIFAEIMGRDSVLNGGRAGSPYFSDARNNFLGENSIVGAGVPIAAGAALTASRRSDRRVAVASIGDGATNQGAVHEALNMAAVLALPLVLIIENNL